MTGVVPAPDTVARPAGRPAGRPAVRTAVLRGVGAEEAVPAHLLADLLDGPEAVDEVLCRSVLADRVARATEDARALGRAEGLDLGRREAREEADARERRHYEEHRAAMLSLDAAVARVDALAAEAMAAVATRVTGLALLLVEEILGRESRLSADPGGDAVARALATAPPGRKVRVRLHPTHAEAAATGAPGAAAGSGGRVEGVADPAVAPGDAVAELDPGWIDAGLASAMERVRAVLEAGA